MAFRMENGLSKLDDAAVQIKDLNVILEQNQAEIAVKNVQIQEVLCAEMCLAREVQ